MRLAVFGFVGKNGGSGPSAYYLLLEEMLQRGCEIDYVGIRGFGIPSELEKYPNFQVHGLNLPVSDRIMDGILKLPRPLRIALGFPFNTYRMVRYARRIGNYIQSQHVKKPYSAVLVVDQLSPLRVGPGLPCVSWPQGPPMGEVEPVVRLRDQVIRHCGRTFYHAFLAYYRYRRFDTRRRLRHSQAIICGSEWAAEGWSRFGVPKDCVFALPFCVDLHCFTDKTPAQRTETDFTFLHLGRMVPRKRLDLLLNGFQLLRREHPEAKLMVIGSVPSEFRGYASLLADPHLMAGVDRRDRVDRSQVPDLLRSVDALIQTSENENFGTAVMEALACGVPVIVGPTNGTKDYIPDSSVVFREYTPEAVCEGMRKIMDVCERSSVSVQAEARRAAEQVFSVENVADQLLSVLKRVIAKHTPDRGKQPCLA